MTIRIDRNGIVEEIEDSRLEPLIASLTAERDALKAERDSYAKQWRLVTKACDSALIELGEARAEQRVLSDGFFEAQQRASLTLRRAEAAEEALRRLRLAARGAHNVWHDTAADDAPRDMQRAMERLGRALDAATAPADGAGEKP